MRSYESCNTWSLPQHISLRPGACFVKETT